MEPADIFKEKLRTARKAERLTQEEMSGITGVPLGTLRNMEQRGYASYDQLRAILSADRMGRYAMWFMLDQTCPEMGQISPAMVEDLRTELNARRQQDGAAHDRNMVITDQMLDERWPVVAKPQRAPFDREMFIREVAHEVDQIMRRHDL